MPFHPLSLPVLYNKTRFGFSISQLEPLECLPYWDDGLSSVGFLVLILFVLVLCLKVFKKFFSIVLLDATCYMMRILSVPSKSSHWA